MTCKLLLLDIDGTLRPDGCSTIPAENVAAIKAVQKLGVKVAIATGRSRAGVSPEMLAGLRPDAWICAGAAGGRQDRRIFGASPYAGGNVRAGGFF